MAKLVNDSLLTVSEAAQRLGCKEGTIRAWILSRQIDFIKVRNKMVRIPEEAISKLIERGFVAAKTESSPLRTTGAQS